MATSGYGSMVALYTAVSIVGIGWRISTALHKRLPLDAGTGTLDPVETARVLQSLFQSSFTIALLANLLINFFVIVALSMKTLFFGTLTLLETQKVVERMINYVLFKGLFLLWVVQPEMVQIVLWLAWFSVLGFLKMFQGLARDRLDRLNASPTATLYSHMRVFSVLVLVLLSDLFWIQLCLLVFKDTGLSTFMLLLFEPLSIAFETLQAVLVHGVQLVDTWQRQTVDVSEELNALKPHDRSAAGAACEWRGMIVRKCSFAMDIVSLLLALGHCLHIWWLRGLAFQVVDAILFLNLRALLSAILKRIKGYVRVQKAMSTLQGALPDASQDEILEYDDDCAICKEPMARAKRLPCSHLFHLACLRSWLDQGVQDTYSCPTCRRPLFMGSPSSEGRQVSDRDHTFPETGADQQNASLWRGSESGGEWMTDGHPPEASSGIELMMRHISSGSDEPPPHHRSNDTIEAMMRQLSSSQASSSARSRWRFWPFSSSQRAPDVPSTSNNINSTGGTSSSNNNNNNSGNSSELMDMVRMVREVLPHVADDVIIQDLSRTSCVIATVNNLL